MPSVLNAKPSMKHDCTPLYGPRENHHRFPARRPSAGAVRGRCGFCWVANTHRSGMRLSLS